MNKQVTGEKEGSLIDYIYICFLFLISILLLQFFFEILSFARKIVQATLDARPYTFGWWLGQYHVK